MLCCGKAGANQTCPGKGAEMLLRTNHEDIAMLQSGDMFETAEWLPCHAEMEPLKQPLVSSVLQGF